MAGPGVGRPGGSGRRDACLGRHPASRRSCLGLSAQSAPAADLTHTLDLLRRANGAVCGWAVGLEDGELEVSGDAHVHKDHLRRGAALVQLASADGRSHVAREPEGTYVAAGDFPYGAGLLLLQPNASTDLAEAVEIGRASCRERVSFLV